MQEAFTLLIMDVCGSQALLYLSESISVVTKLLKKENRGCGYSSCSVCTVFVQACVYMCILTVSMFFLPGLY